MGKKWGKYGESIEKKVMKKADFLIFPLENLRNHFNKLYNINKKALIVNHSYENIKIPNKNKTDVYPPNPITTSGFCFFKIFKILKKL